MQKIFLILLICSLVTPKAFTAEQPRVGREAAAKYFQPRNLAVESNKNSSSDHFLALHLGKFMGSQAWDWGQPGREDDIGNTSIGVTYRVNEWSNSMDLDVRVDFNEYSTQGDKPLKMSLMPLLTFPDATSRFPLYFGIGAGLGVFFKQIKDKSPLAFDYQLIMGARFFNIIENTGFFIETGLKNHLLLTSSGQFNGTFLTGGAVFTF